MTSRLQLTTFALGVVTTLFVLHAWQLYAIRALAVQALEQSQINSQNIQQIGNFLGSKMQPPAAQTSSASSQKSAQ